MLTQRTYSANVSQGRNAKSEDEQNPSSIRLYKRCNPGHLGGASPSAVVEELKVITLLLGFRMPRYQETAEVISRTIRRLFCGYRIFLDHLHTE